MTGNQIFNMNKSIFLGLLLSFSFAFAQDSHMIEFNNPNIVIEGSNYVTFENNELVAHRHSKDVYSGTTKEILFNPIKARTCSGITLNFKTKSPTIKVKFKIVEGSTKAAVFGVFQNDKFVRNNRFKYVPNQIVEIDLASQQSKKAVSYTITFPLMTDVHFLGLELEENQILETLKNVTKKTYLAFGDSITHGTGQSTTQETYPFILANTLGYELFNTAVGGSKTSQVMAEMVRDDFKKIDIMTVLIGYNDYNGEGIDVKTFKERYEAILKTMRETHKSTKIYCISLLTTKMNNSKTSQLPIEPFRNAVKDVVKERQVNGDANIILIEGEKLTKLEDLRDNVHLNVEGAKSFADKLYNIIN